MAATAPFHESRLLTTPIRDLGLTIAGTPLEPVLAQFQEELVRAGIKRVRPHFYLSTEWGVPFGTISIAIPFYLARQDLTDVHAERIGHLEGAGRADLLRYLRHEMGHVINYAYQLYDEEDWIKHFGSMTQPYEENYRPEPFSRRHVLHLPGWYAQKHPDEDWAETFAVWLTPELNWRAFYAAWPDARAKLQYCDHIMALVRAREPKVTATDPDEDVSTLAASLDDYYRADPAAAPEPLPPGLDGALQTVFEDSGKPASAEVRPAGALMARLERSLVANVYRWTGHFPEHTRRLVRHLAERARQLHQVYAAADEEAVAIALTTLVTSLAMNHVCRGSYLP
jgi:hypothetical protein